METTLLAIYHYGLEIYVYFFPQLAPLHSLDGLVLDPGGPNSAHLRGDEATRTGFDLRRNGWLDLRYDPVGGFVVS